MFLLFN